MEINTLRDWRCAALVMTTEALHRYCDGHLLSAAETTIIDTIIATVGEPPVPRKLTVHEQREARQARIRDQLKGE